MISLTEIIFPAVTTKRGALIGKFNIPVIITRQSSPAPYFAVEGQQGLVVAWTLPAKPGVYQVQVKAADGEIAEFPITVQPVPVIHLGPPQGVTPNPDGSWSVILKDAAHTGVQLWPPGTHPPED